MQTLPRLTGFLAVSNQAQGFHSQARKQEFSVGIAREDTTKTRWVLNFALIASHFFCTSRRILPVAFC